MTVAKSVKKVLQVSKVSKLLEVTNKARDVKIALREYKVNNHLHKICENTGFHWPALSRISRINKS